MAEGVHPGWLIGAGLVGAIIGGALASSGIHLKPRDIPDDIAYLRATTENPFPIATLNTKRSTTIGYELGNFVGDVVRMAKAAKAQ